MAKHISILLMLVALAFPVAAFSGESAPAGEAVQFPPPQHFTLDPSLLVYAGYRFTGFTGSGSLRAAEYDYLHDSVAGGLDLHYYPLPFMLDMDFDYKNENDHDGGLTLRFSDILRMDFRSTELFHNMEHYVLVPFGTDFDPAVRYGVDVNDNDLTLVLKSPGRPYHLYVNLREFEKDGTVQQRYIFLNTVSRNIDWVTRELTAGINGNVLGLFELDYHHTIKAFDSKLSDVMLLSGSYRFKTSDLETNTDTLSIHTDQSRPLSAAGTFTMGDKKNKFSGAKVEFHREYGDVTYRPFDNLMFALKYGHQKLMVENPDTFTLLTAPGVTTTLTPIRDSITTTRDKGVAAVSFYPFPKLMLLGKYELDAVKRHNTKQWNDDVALSSLNYTQAASVTHKGTLSAAFTPAPHSKVRASFSYSHNGDPSRIVDFRNAYEGYLWSTWVPAPGLILNAQYKLLRGENPVPNPGNSTESGFVPLDQLNRHVQKDNGGAGVTWLSPYGLVFGAHYDFLRLRLTQNIVYSDGLQTVFSEATPYRDQTHEYTVFAKYCFRFPLSVELAFSQNWSKGNYRLEPELFSNPPGAPALTDGLASLVDQKIRETKGTVRADCEIYKGWGASLMYGISNFRDLVKRDYTGKRDGTAHYGTVLLTKKM